MKVVRSKRLEAVLRDPGAAAQLRRFLASASVNEKPSAAIETRDASGKKVQYAPKLVRVRGVGA